MALKVKAVERLVKFKKDDPGTVEDPDNSTGSETEGGNGSGTSGGGNDDNNNDAPPVINPDTDHPSDGD